MFGFSKYSTLLVLIFSASVILAQNTKSQDSLVGEKQVISQKLFGNIYTGFYYDLTGESKPRQAFELSTGILGYKVNWKGKFGATLIYDVTKTTNDISVTDTSGNALQIGYFSGSDYTAFLKMAQIDWQFHPKILFSIGQLLNQQYLTFQDKFWGYRYVATTFQELYRFGNPADFGARLSFKPIDNLLISPEIVNGEGPFRRQDNDGSMQYALNIEYTLFNSLILKIYTDIHPKENAGTKQVLSGFVGYQTDKWRLGIEANSVENYNNVDENDLTGYSVYGSYKFTSTINTFIRYDYIEKSMTMENGQYGIAGIQYEPEKNFCTSLNFRYFTTESSNDIYKIYVNFGMKF